MTEEESIGAICLETDIEIQGLREGLYRTSNVTNKTNKGTC